MASAPAPLGPREQVEHARLVREMIAKLRGLLDGELERAAVAAWTREVWPEDRQGTPFRWGTAACVFVALCNVDQPDPRDAEAALVRAVELRAYLRWLLDGDELLRIDETRPLAALAPDIEALERTTSTRSRTRSSICSRPWRSMSAT